MPLEARRDTRRTLVEEGRNQGGRRHRGVGNRAGHNHLAVLLRQVDSHLRREGHPVDNRLRVVVRRSRQAGHKARRHRIRQVLVATLGLSISLTRAASGQQVRPSGRPRASKMF